MQKSSFKGDLALLMAFALLLVAILPNHAFAAGKAAVRGKLFVFVRGIDSFLTPEQATAQGGDGSDPYFFRLGALGTYFFRLGALGTYLQNQGYPDARYLEYSYAPLGSTNTGQPLPYRCQDTYDYPLASHILELSRQISSAVQNHANTDVYLIGHSMGGIISFGYLASLLEHVGNTVHLPLLLAHSE